MHLTGPYTAYRDGDVFEITTGSGNLIAGIDKIHDGTTEQKAANAVLLAASWDMLQACRAVLTRHSNPLVGWSVVDDVVAKVRAAVAKATTRVPEAVVWDREEPK